VDRILAAAAAAAAAAAETAAAAVAGAAAAGRAAAESASAAAATVAQAVAASEPTRSWDEIPGVRILGAILGVLLIAAAIRAMFDGKGGR
jgi:hypothetical protein